MKASNKDLKKNKTAVNKNTDNKGIIHKKINIKDASTKSIKKTKNQKENIHFKKNSEDDLEITSKEETSHSRKKIRLSVFKLNNYLLIGIAIIAIILLTLVLIKQYSLFKRTSAVYVNGESISLSDLEEEYKIYLKFISPGEENRFTKKMMLSFMIDETLLMQEAKKNGITVSDLELEKYIDDVIATSLIPITKDDFINQIEANNISYNSIKNLLYKKQYVIQKYLDDAILSKIVINDDELISYFNEVYASTEQDFESLKPAINEELYVRKQYTMYSNLINDLKNTAVIRDNIYSDLSTLTRCLSKHGIVMYGSNEDSDTILQKQELGDAFLYINYIDCKDPSSGTLKEECSGMRVFPIWELNGVFTVGFRSADYLAEISGCSIY